MDHQDGEEYQNIFENANEGRFQLSLDGRLIKTNPAMAQLYGYDSPEDMLISVKNIGKQIYVKAEERDSFLNELLVDGHIEKFECQNYRKDGSIFWAQTTAHVVRKIEGDEYIEGFITDITSRKEAEFALRISEEKYRALVEHLPAVIFLDATNEAQTSLYISPKIQELLGYTPEEWIADPFIWKNSIHPDDKERVVAKDKLTNETGEGFSLEYRLRGKDGSYRWIREESSLILDPKGCPLYWQGFLLDISAQKQAESTISQNGEQFKRIFQANPIASLIATFEEGRFIAANDAYWKLSGYEPTEFLGRTSVELGFISKDKRNELVTRLKNERTIRNASGKLVTKKGEIRDTLEFYELIRFDEQECILAMFYDVTEQVKAQLELQDNEERYRQLYESESDAIFLIDNETGKILEVNAAATSLYGYSKKELLNKKNSDLSAEVEETRKVTQDTPIKKDKVVSIPFRFHRKKDGTVFPVEITGRFFEWRGRSVHIAAIRDITERKRAEDTYKRQLEDLIILHNIAVAASSSNSLDELIERTTNSIFDTLHPDNCGVGLVTDRGETYQAHPSYHGAATTEIRKSFPVSKGITGKVISTGVSIRLGNVSEAPAFFEAMKGIQSELCVPISIQDRIIGAINIESKKADAYDESDERLLNTIAGTLATAIERLRLFETSQRRLKELTILNRVSLVSTAATSIDELIEKITQIIGESLYPDNFGVLLLNEYGNALRPHASYRGITNGKFPPEIPFGRGVSGQVATSGKPLRIANVRNHRNYIEVTSQVRSELCVPISHGECILGVINAESLKINAFTEDDEQLLATIASTLATSIEKLRLLEAEKKRRQEAETLLDATTTLTTSINFDSLLETILVTLSRIVPYDSASIAIQQESTLLIIAGRGFPSGYHVIGKQLAYSDKWLRLSATHKPIIVPDAQSDPTFEQWEGSEYIRGWMSVPMVVHGKLKGFIHLDNRKPSIF
jgi:PAS domain S-box-containing protein